jgi:septum site-determining protein MinC
MRLLGRSYMAFVLTPEGSITEWLAELDAWIARSPGFFAGRAVVLDLTSMEPTKAAIAQLIASLEQRGIRVMGLEGADPAVLGPELPPPLTGGRSSTTIETAPAAAAGTHASASLPSPERPGATLPKLPTSLVLDSPVRSGQSIVFPEGDVTVLGSVGSGAEIVAGGSVHVYGTLRGRAMAGATGNPRARIFCHKIEAELLAIDGYYRTADEIDAQLRSRPVQAWLDGNTMMITALN